MFVLKKLIIIILILALVFSGCDATGNQNINITPQVSNPQSSFTPIITYTQSESPIIIATPESTITLPLEEKKADCHYVKTALSDEDYVRNIIYCFDSAWIDYVNNNDNSIYDYVAKPSPAEKSINEFDTANLKEEFIKLDVKSVYVKDNIAYAAVFEELKKDKNGASITKNYKWIYKLTKANNEWLIHSFGSVIPQSMLSELSDFVSSKQYEKAIDLADVITNIWITNENSSFSYGEYYQDLAYVRLHQGIDEYNNIELLQPQDGVDLHKKNYWLLDIALMFALVEEYDKAHEIYDNLINFNDVNVVGACVGKAESYRRQGLFEKMTEWLDNAELAFNNNDILP